MIGKSGIAVRNIERAPAAAVATVTAPSTPTAE